MKAVLIGIVALALVIGGVLLMRQPSDLSNVSTPSQELFEAGTTKRVNDAKIAVIASYRFATNHNGLWPTSFAQLNGEYPKSQLADSDWEFLSGGSRSTLTDPAHTILFREKQPRRAPDGAYVRIYALADSSIQKLTSEEPDFSAVERQRGYLVRAGSN